MAREHLFRGFHIDGIGTQTIVANGEEHNGEWIEGFAYEHKPPLVCMENSYIPAKSKWFILKTAFADWGMERGMDAFEVLPETVGEYIKSLPNGDKAFSNSRFEIISNVKGEDGGSGKRTDTAIIRFNDKQTEWELKVFHNGKYKRIARAGYFLNSNETKVIGTIFDKEVA